MSKKLLAAVGLAAGTRPRLCMTRTHLSIGATVITRLPYISSRSNHRFEHRPSFKALEVTAQLNLPGNRAHNNLNGEQSLVGGAVSGTESTVLILGETGSGKEFPARLFSVSSCLTKWRGRTSMETFRARRIDKDSDAALVSATKRGDARAFEKLVLRHKPRVLAAAQWITKNREDAEDVMQESFHKAYLHLDDFQERSLFSTWLTRIAKNQALMLLRRRRRAFEVSPASPDDGAQSVSEAFVDASPNPEESCARRECIELLADAINRLSPTIRRTILLRDIEEHSLEETAQILGASIPAVKARVSRGRRELGGGRLRLKALKKPFPELWNSLGQNDRLRSGVPMACSSRLSCSAFSGSIE